MTKKKKIVSHDYREYINDAIKPKCDFLLSF